MTNPEISVITETYTVVDISNEHKSFQFAVWSVTCFNWVVILSLSLLFGSTLLFHGFSPFDTYKSIIFFLTLWYSSFCLHASFIFPFASHQKSCALLWFSPMVSHSFLVIFLLMIFEIFLQGQSDSYLFLCWEEESQDFLLSGRHPTFFNPPAPPIPPPSPTFYSLRSFLFLILLPKIEWLSTTSLCDRNLGHVFGFFLYIFSFYKKK